MSRRQNPSSNPVPLFQFLDLFLCTIGTLIVMLVIMTTKIRQDTINREIDRIIAKETDTTPIDPPEPTPQVTTTPVEPTAPDTSVADAHRAAISQALDQLSKLEERGLALSAELAQRQRAITSLEQQANQTAADTQEASASKKELERRLREALASRNQELTELQQLKSEQTRLREQILESQKRLAAAKQREGNSEYVIVPYDGVTGTTRRPIIIECKGTTIRFVAEDVTVELTDMEPFRSGSDPVAAGIAELVQYWVGKANAGGPAKAESLPYVLLVVRPSGLPAYLLTRRSLDATGIDFGYELVAEDFAYASPETDARAKELCKAAVEQTIKDGPQARTGRVFVLEDGNRSGGGGGGGSSPTRRSASDRPPAGTRGPSGPSRGGPSGSPTASRSGSMRQYGGIDSGALSRGGTGSAKFFSSSSFLDHRDQIEVASSEPLSPPSSRRKPGELQLSDDESPLIPTRAETAAGSPAPRIAANAKPSAPPQNLPQTDATASPVPTRPATSEIEDMAPPPPKPAATASAKTKAASSGGIGASSRTQGADEETLEEQVTESPLMKDRDLKNLSSFKRQWGIHNPKGSIALEKKMPVALDGQRIIVGNRLKITRHEDRSNKQLADLTILAIDEVAKDWGPPPDQFYWVPTIDLSVYAGGELLIEPLQKSLKQTGVIVNVLYQ